MVVALQGHETSDTTKMRAAAERALSINQKCPEALNLLAICADSYDKALECYNTALNLAPQAVIDKAREEALALMLSCPRWSLQLPPALALVPSTVCSCPNPTQGWKARRGRGGMEETDEDSRPVSVQRGLVANHGLR
jgi:hypothetical protein